MSKLKSYLITEEKFNGYLEVDKEKLALIKLFQSDKKINDHKDIHKLAEDMGMQSNKLEEMVYAMLQSFWSKGRAMDKGMDFEVDKKEVDMGIKVEMEHTDCECLAYRIALDHLAELKDYYTRLAKMEDEGGVNESLIVESVDDLKEEVFYYLMERIGSGPWAVFESYGSKGFEAAKSFKKELETINKETRKNYRIVKCIKKFEVTG